MVKEKQEKCTPCMEPCEHESIEVGLSDNWFPAKNHIDPLLAYVHEHMKKNDTVEQLKRSYAAINIFLENMAIQVCEL